MDAQRPGPIQNGILATCGLRTKFGDDGPSYRPSCSVNARAGSYENYSISLRPDFKVSNMISCIDEALGEAPRERVGLGSPLKICWADCGDYFIEDTNMLREGVRHPSIRCAAKDKIRSP